MSQRTTITAVREVLEPGQDYDTVESPSLQPFIDTATVIVDRVSTCATNKDITLTETELELIERWLSAHLYCMSDQQYANKSTEGASASFRAAGGLNLDGTTYGQTAQTIDYSGCLSAIGKRQVAGGFWLGKAPSSQIPYSDRD